MKILDDVCQRLEEEANDLAERAESQKQPEMLRMLTKSNALRKSSKEKKVEKDKLQKQICDAMADVQN